MTVLEVMKLNKRELKNFVEQKWNSRGSPIFVVKYPKHCALIKDIVK